MTESPNSSSNSGSLSRQSSETTWYGLTKWAKGINHHPTAQPGENSKSLALSGDRLLNALYNQTKNMTMALHPISNSNIPITSIKARKGIHKSIIF